MPDTLEEVLAAAEARKAELSGSSSGTDLQTLVVAARKRKNELASAANPPDIAAQDEAMARPSVAREAFTRFVAGHPFLGEQGPAVLEKAMQDLRLIPSREHGSIFGPDLRATTPDVTDQVTEELIRRRDDPQASEEDRRMAEAALRSRGVSGTSYPARLAHGLGESSQFVFAGMAPGLTTAITAAQSVPGGDVPLRVAGEAAAAPGGAIARAVGAEPGGGGEALGRTLSSILLPGLVAGGLRYGGARMLPESPAPRLSQLLQDPNLPLSEVPSVVRGGGGVRNLVGAPELLDLGAIGTGIVGAQAGPEAANLASKLGAGEGGQALADVAGNVLGTIPGALVEAGGARRGAAARERLNASRAAAEGAQAAEVARQAAEADARARQEAASGLAGAVGKAAEVAPQEPPPPSPEAIRASMDLSAATSRAADALRNPPPPVQEPIPGAEAQASGADFRAGDTAVWWDQKGARHYGTVEGVSPDGKVLKLRVPGRRTPVGVPADAADRVNRGPEPPPAQPVPPEAAPVPVVPPRVAAQPPAVQRQPGIAPEAPPPSAPLPPVPRGTLPPRIPEVPHGPSEAEARLLEENAALSGLPKVRATPVTDAVRQEILAAPDKAAATDAAYHAMRAGYDPMEVRKVLEARAAGETPGMAALRAGETPAPRKPSEAFLNPPPEVPPAAPKGEPALPPAEASAPAPGAALPTAAPPARPPEASATGAVPTAPPAGEAPATPPPARASAARARKGRAPAEAPAPRPAASTDAGAPAPTTQTIPTAEAVKMADPNVPLHRIRKEEGAYLDNLKADIRKNGMKKPIVIVNGRVFDGAHRLAAAEDLGLKEVPVVYESKPPEVQPPAAPAAEKAKPPFPPTTLGSNLGNVDWKHPQVQAALRSTVGAAAGYLTALATEGQDDDPKTIWARRIGYAAIGAAALGGGIPGWQKLRTAAAGLRKAKLTDEMASEIRQNVTELRNAKTDATTEGNRQILAKQVFKDPEQQFVWNEYLRDAHGSEGPFLDLLAGVADKDPALANQLLDTAQAWRDFSSNLGDEGVAAGRVSPEARAERPGGHLTRIPADKAEGARGWFARFRKQVPKFTPEKVAHDGWGGRVTLSPEEVRAELANLGLEDPTGKRDHYLKGDANGTLIKWAPTQEGFDQASRFFERMGELEKQASERKISASSIRGGGDPRMVVQVGKGSNADIGHLAEPKWDEKSLRLKMPRAMAREVAAGVGVEPPKISESGTALRAEFATPEARQSFLDGVRELAVEQATFNVTPQARRWFAQRLKGATVRVGPGSSGGATGRIISDTFGPRSREQMLTDVQDPVVRAYVTALRGGQRNAQARHLTRIAFGEDAKGPWTVDAPEGAKPGDVHTVGDQNYVVQEDAPQLGDLAGRALRQDWHDVLQSKQATAPQEQGFWRSFVGQVKGGKIATSAGTIFNNVQNLLFHANAGTSPWLHPIETVKVARDFLLAHARGDLSTLNEKYGKDAGFTLGEGQVLDADAAEGIRAIQRGAQSAQEISAGTRGKVGRLAADVLQQGVLADPGAPGWGRTAKGLAISSAAGAATGGLSGYLSDDDTETILAKMLKGAALGAGFGAAARMGRAAFGGTDPFHRALAYQILTKNSGRWGEALSPTEARDYLHRKFQDFENMDPRVRAISGQANGIGAAMVNEFAPAYFETMRVMKNNLVDNPPLAVVTLMSIPAVAAIVAYAAHTFGSEEERRAAKENAPPGAFFRHGEDGQLYAFDVNRMTGADVAVDLVSALGDAGNPDSWRQILTDFGGSMIGTTVYDTAHAAFDPEAKDIRYGMKLRQPGETGAHAAVKTLVRGLAAPYSPEFGTTASMVRDSLEKPFKPGREPRPTEPAMSVVRAVTGIKRTPIDFGRAGLRLTLDRAAEIQKAKLDLDEALKQANTQADPKEVARQQKRMQDRIEAANLRFEEEMKRLTPQPVGAGR